MHESPYQRTLGVLKANKVRLTPQREAIIQFLIDSTAHPTAEQIYHELAADFPNMSVATVYNNLKLLVKLNLVEEMAVSDVATHYDFAITPHYHAVCTRCGRIVDFYPQAVVNVSDAVQQQTGFLVTGHQLEVFGLCPQCQQELKEADHQAEDGH